MAENEVVVEKDVGTGTVPLAAATPINVPEQLPQYELADAREAVGNGAYCVNCSHFNFDLVYGPKYGACDLRPKKEAKVEVEYTCVEFSKA